MRERQAAQVAAAFIIRAGKAVGVVKLIKLMYLAEREAMKRFVFPIVLDDIYAMQMGMALSRTYNLMQGREGTPSDGEWGRHIVRTNRGLNIRRGVSSTTLGGLSRNDLKVIDDVWAKYGSLNTDELVHEVHHGLAEWIDHWGDPARRSAAVRVPYETLYRTLLGMDEADAADAAAEVSYFKALGQANQMRN